MGKYFLVKGTVLGLLWACFATMPANAAEPYEFDPVLSLTGNCAVSAFDPIPDPSCAGEPPAYPPPPSRPSGRFDEPTGIAFDPFGNEYVASFAESVDAAGRTDVFDDEGRFITEVATPDPSSIAVDSKGNLYVFNSQNGDVARYSPSASSDPEAGEITYEDPPVTVSTGLFVGAVAIDAANDQLLVARPGAITRYRSAAEGNGVLESFSPTDMGAWTEAIAVDSQRERIYVSYCADGNKECGIKVVEASAPHATLENIDGSTTPAGKFFALSSRLGIAVDEQTGDFFVGDIVPAKIVYQFGEDYEYLSEIQSAEFEATASTQIAVSNGERSLAAEPCLYPNPEVPAGDACNRHYLVVPKSTSAGRAIAFHPPGKTAPEIEKVWTSAIGETEAGLRGTISSGGLETTYVFEYTTQKAFEEKGNFEGAAILNEGTIPGQSQATDVWTLAAGLEPGETYRFRLRAENAVGAAAEAGQNEAVFATYNDAPTSSCPSQGPLSSFSKLLPDCRGYELVTPPETNGRPPRGIGFGGSQFNTVQASPDGDDVSFRIEGGSLPGSSGTGSFTGDPYTADRGASGWSSELSGPSGGEATLSFPGSVSPDQGHSFWTALNEGSAVINGDATEYVRYPDGESALLGQGSLGVDPKANGKLITNNGSHIVFETKNDGVTKAIQLEPEAPPTGTSTVYDRTPDEITHVVSLLPGNITPAAGQNATYLGSSNDGGGIAFAIGSKLYLRVGNETSYEIGESVEFAGVSEGGGRIFYVEGGDLKAFDTASEEVINFSSTADVTPVNVSTGGSRAYFVSPSVLGGANPEGDVALAGEQNLYLSQEGAISFVATVTDRDVEGEIPPFQSTAFDGLGLWSEALVGRQLSRDPSRVNPSGSILLFQSRANITGYEEGEVPQIYRYDSAAGNLQCISCIPTKRPATGGASLETYAFDPTDPPPFSASGFVPNLALDGKRVFFESTEALVSTDTDEVQDVYEWEGEGVGSCERSGGCVYLISSGHSARDDFLFSHSESGSDVFFTSGDVLTGFDAGPATSIYDARVDGGFPEPLEEDDCMNDACRPIVTPPPPAPSLASSAQGTSGNVAAGRPRSCPKGKRKVNKNGKVRCVKKKKKKNKGDKAKRAGANRGAGK